MIIDVTSAIQSCARLRIERMAAAKIRVGCIHGAPFDWSYTCFDGERVKREVALYFYDVRTMLYLPLCAG